MRPAPGKSAAFPRIGAPRARLPYRGSLRQLRGAVLAETLRRPQASRAELAVAVSAVPGATPERVRSALDGLTADGLIAGRPTRRR